jgi:hypothetical protein
MDLPVVKPIIITGCKRSGTAYISTLITVSGYWCSHERFFKGSMRWGINPLMIQDKYPGVIESSYAAAPFIDAMDVHRVHQVRHPLLVTASIMAREGYNLDKRKDWTIKKCPQSAEPGDDRLSLILRFWLEWNRMVARSADYRWRLEEVLADPGIIAEPLTEWGRPVSRDQVELGASVLPGRVNESSVPLTRLSWGDIPEGKLKGEVMSAAEGYGYGLDPQ